MSRVLILGAGGMAGHIIRQYLQQTGNYEVVSTYRSAGNNINDIQIDISEGEKVKKIIDEISPVIIINCIGALLKEAVATPHKAIYTNAYFPHYLALIANNQGAKVIHLSTDCVFSGRKGGYTEMDTKDAQDVYGQSKSLGELNDAFNLTIRTSIIGPELKKNGEGLFHWFMQKQDIAEGFSKVWWSGITTLELAKFIAYIIPLKLTGLVHLTNGQPINKYELLLLMQSIFNKTDIQLQENTGKQANKSLIMSNKIPGFQVASYRNMIEEMKLFMQINKAFYPAYATYL